MLNQLRDGDGDVYLAIDNDCFKVHFARLSPFIKGLPIEDDGLHDKPLIRLASGGIARALDVEALLQVIYELSQPIERAQFVQAARILRAATQFEFPDLRETALARLKELYSPRPKPFACAEWHYIHEATQLAIDCRAREILPTLLYAIVTTSDFDVDGLERIDDPPAEVESVKNTEDDETRGRVLSGYTTGVCVQLMKEIMDHFTPILFTVPTSAHMECTGVFADHWMERAIQPAITESGVYKPLETLHKIQGVDWRGLGLCEGCWMAKKEEWDDEADDVWQRIEGWVGVYCVDL